MLDLDELQKKLFLKKNTLDFQISEEKERDIDVDHCYAGNAESSLKICLKKKQKIFKR